MSDLACEETNKSEDWGIIDVIVWKMVPQRFGGGIPYIQKYKDAWVRHNKMFIKKSAIQYNLPPQLLAGVSWIEVGGDPTFIDGVAFNVRAFVWSGPDWVDKHLAMTKSPGKTSFGPVSIQLRTAAQTLGRNPAKMSDADFRSLAHCLENDVFNLGVVAHHLRNLINHDGFQDSLPNLSMEQVRIVGARYNRGIGLSLKDIKKNTSYGDFIVKFWPRFSGLLI